MDIKEYDALIMVTPKDFLRVEVLYERLLKYLPARNIFFVGSKEVEILLNTFIEKSCGKIDKCLLGKMGYIDENEILPFEDVQTVMKEALKEQLNGQELPRGITGWYYQQFLKMQYAYMCKDEYYLVWDGDTVPCKEFSMFRPGTEIPYLDTKSEYHEDYFVTIGKILPGMGKVIQRSFIAEHMLMNTDIMRKLIEKIEQNNAINGDKYYEKIINCIEPKKLISNSFSEFETYGTFAAITSTYSYALREWHSFRYAGEFFEMDEIDDVDWEWLSHDFFAASFEKEHSVRDDHKNLFDNKEYQAKISARKMLEIVQQEFGEECYRELWSD